MTDLVHDRATDLVDHLLLGRADGTDSLAIDRDPVREQAGVVGGALGERDAHVQAEQARRSAVEFDDDRNVAHQPTELRWQPVECEADHRLEPSPVHLDHAPIVPLAAPAHDLVADLRSGPPTCNKIAKAAHG